MIFNTSLLATIMFFSSDPSADWVKLLSSASGPTVMAVIIIGAIKEWWIPGKTHRRTVAERDALLKLALDGQEIGTRALDAASVIASKSDHRR